MINLIYLQPGTMRQTKLKSTFVSFIFCLCTTAFPVYAEKSLDLTTFPSLDLAQPEINKLNAQIAAIEAKKGKDFAEASKIVNQRYAEQLNALNNVHRIESETATAFKARQEKKRECWQGFWV